MNNAKIWLVVNPTVGLPLLLTGVAVSSFAVHLALVNNTTWIEAYHQGEDIAAVATDSDVQTAKAGSALQDGDRLQVTLPDGSTAWAVIETPRTTMASMVPRRD